MMSLIFNSTTYRSDVYMNMLHFWKKIFLLLGEFLWDTCRRKRKFLTPVEGPNGQKKKRLMQYLELNLNCLKLLALNGDMKFLLPIESNVIDHDTMLLNV